MKNTFTSTITAGTIILAAAGAVQAASYNVPLEGLVGYWTGNGTAADASPQNNGGGFNGSYATGAPSGGKAFNVGSAKVSIAPIGAYNFKNYSGWSVGFWFNANGSTIGPSNGLFLGQDNGSGYKPKWFIDYAYNVYANNSSFNFHVNDFNQERIFILSNPLPPPTGWNQLTVTIDNDHGGQVTFYLNGRPFGGGGLGNYALQTTANLVFGQAEGLSFNGLMSDVVIYNRVLSADEAAALASPTFSITSIALNPDGNALVSWESIAGWTYRLVGTSNLNDPVTWTAMGDPVTASGPESSLVIPASNSATFLRVKRE